MMTDELVKGLRNNADHYMTVDGKAGLVHLLTDAADAIEELSRRETPMRVGTTTSTKRCPACNKQLSGIGNIHRNYPFCRWCGQALDWTEPPKEKT